MQYLGGKSRIGKRIATILERLRKPGQPYLEPFIGGANVVVHVTGERAAGDIDEDVVALWKAARDGWCPPRNVSEDEYATAKVDPTIPPHLRGFIKYACSWGGKPWGGYARAHKEDRNYARSGAESVGHKARHLLGVDIQCRPYDSWSPRGALIYCDPPYANTTGYRVKFDNERFWSVVREWSAENTVVVSEYSAPDDFACIAEFTSTRPIDNKQSTERLFMPQAPASEAA